MKMSKLRIAVLLWLAVTVIYSMTLFQSMKAYGEMRQEGLFWGSRNGFWLVIDGGVLGLAWFGLIYSVAERKVSERKKPTVNPLEACSPPSPKEKGRKRTKKKGEKNNENEKSIENNPNIDGNINGDLR